MDDKHQVLKLDKLFLVGFKRGESLRVGFAEIIDLVTRLNKAVKSEVWLIILCGYSSSGPAPMKVVFPWHGHARALGAAHYSMGSKVFLDKGLGEALEPKFDKGFDVLVDGETAIFVCIELCVERAPLVERAPQLAKLFQIYDIVAIAVALPKKEAQRGPREPIRIKGEQSIVQIYLAPDCVVC